MTKSVPEKGRLSLATVSDLFSRRLFGSVVGAHHDADSVVVALNMAGATRGSGLRRVIFQRARQ
ncbi:hypothetical protein ABZ281_20580 [Streptomyces sp. NPDC006265]|uniref:hypothetical protein n=1 Tax=Streptomyces sp. NPDC006265 TaxID=3156740 RepID=UPI0033A12F29